MKIFKPAILCGLLLTSVLITCTTFAQMKSSNAPATAPSGGGFQNQSDTTISEFDGITVKVVRMVKDPNTEGAFRLILSVTENTDEERLVALVTPVTVMIDEMGNVYQAVGSNGIAICSYKKIWDADTEYCGRYAQTDTTRLTPNLPTTLVLYMAPAELNFSKELADLATVASLQSRFGYYPIDFKSLNHADIVINNIQIPQ